MNITNLADWNVQAVEETGDYHHITAQYRIQPSACQKCCSSQQLKRYGTVHQDIHDLPTLGKPSIINVIRQRYKCGDCGAVFAQPLPDLHEHGTMTTRLEAFNGLAKMANRLGRGLWADPSPTPPWAYRKPK